MKNILKISAVLLVITLVSGCSFSKKQLVCTINQDVTGMQSTNIVTIDYTNDTIDEIDVNIKLELDDKSKNETAIDIIKNSIEDQYKNYKGVKGTEVKIYDDGDNIYTEINSNLKKMSNSDKEKLKLNFGTKTYKEDKKDFENRGYTCK